jgi:hypothetical protein
MRNETDERIKKAFLECTKEAVELTESVWYNIDNALDYTFNEKQDKFRKNKFRRSWVNILPKSIAAVVFLVFLAVGTTPGVSAINKMKSILVPKKNVVHKLEGQDHEEKVNLVESKRGYTIYIDENYYKVELLSDRDRITPKDKSADVPEVYMEIQQVSGTKPEEVYPKLEKELKISNDVVNSTGKVVKPLDALSISASVGRKWNDKLVVYYIVPDKKGGSFIIKEQLFNEGVEGFGGRFDNCLKEFRVEE